MIEYKGYRIETTVPNFWTSAAMANYRVDSRNKRGWQRAHEGTIRGSFKDLDAAHFAADAAARLWVDQQNATVSRESAVMSESLAFGQRLPARRVMNQDTELAPCPRCGKLEGELSESRTRPRPFLVFCGSCGFVTEPAGMKSVAVKLWNEAKAAK